MEKYAYLIFVLLSLIFAFLLFQNNNIILAIMWLCSTIMYVAIFFAECKIKRMFNKSKPKNECPIILPPYQVAYRLSKIFMGGKHDDDPGCPMAYGAMAKTITSLYIEDYARCVDVCKMIFDDEKRIRQEKLEALKVGEETEK